MEKKSTTQMTNIDKYLQGADFPADRKELERVAKQNNAPQDVVDGIRRLPDQRFNTARDVSKSFQGNR